MQLNKKTLLTALVVGVIAGTIAVMSTPAVPESCRTFREEMKQLTLSENGFASVVASVPERVLDQAMRQRYADMTAEQCTQLTPKITQGIAALGQTPWAVKMPQAAQDATSAVMGCRDRRMSGELKSHSESAECSNPDITKAYLGIGYPYMDLVKQFTDKRLDQAQKLDKSAFPATEDQLEFVNLALSIADKESARALKAAGR